MQNVTCTIRRRRRRTRRKEGVREEEEEEEEEEGTRPLPRLQEPTCYVYSAWFTCALLPSLPSILPLQPPSSRALVLVH